MLKNQSLFREYGTVYRKRGNDEKNSFWQIQRGRCPLLTIITGEQKLNLVFGCALCVKIGATRRAFV